MDVNRIIPALAGNTYVQINPSVFDPDHPRAGGEHILIPTGIGLLFGSSPRWRGTPYHGVHERRN